MPLKNPLPGKDVDCLSLDEAEFVLVLGRVGEQDHALLLHWSIYNMIIIWNKDK